MSTTETECLTLRHLAGTRSIRPLRPYRLGCEEVTSQKSPPELPSRSSVSQTKLNWRPALPSLVVVGVIVLAGFALQRPDPEKELSPAPRGWVESSATGKTLALAFAQDRVFAGGRDGLYELDRQTGKLVREVNLGKHRLHIRSSAADSDGSLWIGHLDGLCHMTDKGIQTWSVADGLPAERVNVVKVFSDGVIIGTSDGFSKGSPEGGPRR